MPIPRPVTTLLFPILLVALQSPGLAAQQRAPGSSGENLAEARRMAEQRVAAAPRDWRPRESLGRALLELDEFAGAARELEYAAELGTAQSARAIFWEHFEALLKSNRGVDARWLLDEAANDPERDTIEVHAFALAQLNILVGRVRPAGGMRTSRFTSSDFGSVESYLALGDTAEAETRLARMEEAFHERPFRYRMTFAFDLQLWLGRAWVLMGDLAAARGRRDDARRFYERVVGLWGGGGADAEVEPVVAQARARLDPLGQR